MKRRRTLLKSEGIEFDANGRATIGGYEVVDLGLPSGTLWATCDVGSSEEYQWGYFYKWGKGSITYSKSGSSYNGTENPLMIYNDNANVVM